MTFLHAIILGIIEGFTEYLPVSSTAHLIVVSRFLGLADTAFLRSFTIIIQLGAILAVVVLYVRRFLTDWETGKRIAVAFLPTAAIGFVLYKIVKSSFIGNARLALIVLAIGGLGLIIFEWWYKSDKATITDVRNLSYGKAFVIGCAQALAVVPGVSRSAATIVSGMIVGVERSAVIEFSFLLAVPTMVVATGYDFLKNFHEFTLGQANLLAVGFVTAFLFACLGVSFFLRFEKKHSFMGFGMYRIVFALAAYAWLFLMH